MIFGGSKRRQKRKLKLTNGQLLFRIPCLEESEKYLTWDIDLVTLKLTIEELQQKHSLTLSEEGQYIATGIFLDELVQVLSSLGCSNCTVSIARQIWITTADTFEAEELRFKIRLAKFLR